MFKLILSRLSIMLKQRLAYRALDKRKPPFKVIGRFVPFPGKEITEEDIRDHLDKITFNLGVGVDFNVRSPRYNVEGIDDVHKWHSDCFGDANDVYLWSTGPTTLIKWKHGKRIFRPRPYDLIVFKNKHVIHAAPVATYQDKRWSAVART